MIRHWLCILRAWLFGGWLTWRTERENGGLIIAVVPVRDAVHHARYDDECICGPSVEIHQPECCDQHPDNWLLIHHAIDGRE